ncbi:ATP-binding protein [Falsibacillus albus]|nr:ATP-binding protein [Falsibacillus albus]
MRDSLHLGNLVIACDNSGAVGIKSDDIVYAPNTITAYYSFRVAVMECMADGGVPEAVIMQNFSGEEAWSEYCDGILMGTRELGINPLQITGSSESNFPLKQSGLGLTVLGRRNDIHNNNLATNHFAVIGMPLVGSEVLTKPIDILPLSLFKRLIVDRFDVYPVGSKGILHKLKQLTHNSTLSAEKVKCSLDVNKSAGPATCAVVAFDKCSGEKLKELAGHLFHHVDIANDHN